MKTALTKFTALFLVVLSGAAFAAAEELNMQTLLKGSKIPLKRPYPYSKTVNACEDFHRYVCEPAEKAFKLPADRSVWIFSFADSAERLLYVKKAYFKKLAAGLEPKLERTKNVKRLYQACMNRATRKQEEKEFVKTHTDKIMAAKEAKDLRALINERLLTPDGVLVDVFEAANQDNPRRNDAAIIPSGMTLPERSYYGDKKAVADLHSLAEAFFKEIKVDKPKQRATAVSEFEKAFAEIFPVPAELRKVYSENTYMKREDIVSMYPNIDFKRVFNQLGKDAKVRNYTKDAMAFLNKYMGEASAFDLQSLMLFHTIKSEMDEAYPEFYKKMHEFRRKHLGGPPKRPPLDERCTSAAMSGLGRELDAELISVLFPDFDGAKVRDVAEGVRQSVIATLKRNTWLTDGARTEAISKIKDATLRLIKPDADRDWNFLEVGQLSDSKPLENSYTLARAGIAQMLKKIREERNRSEWFMGPLTVNAYYSAEDNQFVLPQGILQYPFFDAAQSRIENLGAAGVVVGHELGHGIDDEGSKYDSKGTLRKWMSDKDMNAFNERTTKLIQQFDKAGHNGKFTLGENIGDLVGVNVAEEAAFPEPEKASMNDVKKFFEAYARVWCGVMTPEKRKVRLKTDPHAQPDARINQQVIHRDMFYKAYGCKAGDKMYLAPEDRVRVW